MPSFSRLKQSKNNSLYTFRDARPVVHTCPQTLRTCNISFFSRNEVSTYYALALVHTMKLVQAQTMRGSTTVIDVAVETPKRLHWVQDISVSNIVQVSGCCNWMFHRIPQSVQTNTTTTRVRIVQFPSSCWVSDHLTISCREDWATESVVKRTEL